MSKRTVSGSTGVWSADESLRKLFISCRWLLALSLLLFTAVIHSDPISADVTSIIFTSSADEKVNGVLREIASAAIVHTLDTEHGVDTVIFVTPFELRDLAIVLRTFRAGKHQDEWVLRRYPDSGIDKSPFVSSDYKAFAQSLRKSFGDDLLLVRRPNELAVVCATTLLPCNESIELSRITYLKHNGIYCSYGLVSSLDRKANLITLSIANLVKFDGTQIVLIVPEPQKTATSAAAACLAKLVQR
jgi:hypothetical protein